MGHFLFSVNGPDLVQCLDGWRQATMHTEDLKDKQEECIHPTAGAYYVMTRTEKLLKQALSSSKVLLSYISKWNTSYLAINDSREGQIVEYLSAVSPDSDRAVLAETFVVEAVDLGDLPGLVVSPNQGYPVRVAHLRSTTETKRWDQGIS